MSEAEIKIVEGEKVSDTLKVSDTQASKRIAFTDKNSSYEKVANKIGEAFKNI